MMAVACLITGACSTQPSEDARQNRRLVDGLLTAVTTKNRKELDKCMFMLDERRAASLLSQQQHELLSDIYAEAKSGEWAKAEDALYKFREADPFPK